VVDCFEISAMRFPGGRHQRSGCRGSSGFPLHQMPILNGSYSIYSIRLPFPTPPKCHKLWRDNRQQSLLWLLWSNQNNGRLIKAADQPHRLCCWIVQRYNYSSLRSNTDDRVWEKGRNENANWS